MSPPWLPFGSFLADPPGTGSPPCPPVLAVAPEAAPLWPGLGWDVHPGVAYSRDKVMWVRSKPGWWGGHASGTSTDAESGMPSPRRGCWEGRQDLVDLHFLGIFLLWWSLGVALTYSQGLGFLLNTLPNFGQEESRRRSLCVMGEERRRFM